MEREISSGAMLGVVLLALAAVIGLGFGVFAIAKGVANEGTVGVQDSLGAVSQQVFLDYDQKIITGTQAIAGLKTFEGKPYAVLFRTNALKNGRDVANEEIRPNGIYFVEYNGKIFINYNAIIAEAKGVTPKPTPITSAGVNAPATADVKIELLNGAYVMSDGFAAENGNVVFDNQTGGMFKTGNAEYVSSASKFQANLLKDPTGNNMGIVLEEIAN